VIVFADISASHIRQSSQFLPHAMPYIPPTGMFYPPPMHPMMQHMYMQMSDSQLTNQHASFTNQPPRPQPNFTVKVTIQ